MMMPVGIGFRLSCEGRSYSSCWVRYSEFSSPFHRRLPYAGIPGDYVEGCVTVYFFSLIVSVITAPADGILAYVLPIPERGPLTAVVGAAVAVGLSLYWWTQMGNKMVPPSLYSQIPIAIIGGFSMGACSLLSHNYRRSKA
jgi:hypothetical protein